MIEAAKTLTDFAQIATRKGRPPIRLRRPTAADGAAVWALIAASPPLDQNSRYANLLQCTHFAAGCAVAECEGRVVGWASSYRLPDDPRTLFVWQIAVDAAHRGRKLGRALLRELLSRPAPPRIRRIQTSISPGNEGSWALFRSLARDLRASIASEPWLDRNAHFEGRHDDELLVTIEPLRAAR